MSHDYQPQRVPGTGITFERRGRGGLAVLFVHGFLQGRVAWNDLVNAARTDGVELVRMDLAGMGSRHDDPGPYGLERFADEVARVIDALAKPVVLVGHSIGTQIAELAAARRPRAVRGVVLVAPIPLGGTGFPQEGLAPARAAAGDPAALRAVGQALYDKLPAARSAELVAVAALMRPDAVRGIGDSFNDGHPDGTAPSRYAGPVLLLPGTEDRVADAAVVATRIRPRFARVRSVPIAGAAHFPHIEEPAAVAAAYDEFIAEIRSSRSPRKPSAGLLP